MTLGPLQHDDSPSLYDSSCNLKREKNSLAPPSPPWGSAVARQRILMGHVHQSETFHKTKGDGGGGQSLHRRLQEVVLETTAIPACG